MVDKHGKIMINHEYAAPQRKVSTYKKAAFNPTIQPLHSYIIHSITCIAYMSILICKLLFGPIMHQNVSMTMAAMGHNVFCHCHSIYIPCRETPEEIVKILSHNPSYHAKL